MQAPTTYRVAIVGCGRMATRFHAPSFAAQPDCRIVQVSENQFGHGLESQQALPEFFGEYR